MRKLMRVTIGFAVACAICAYLDIGSRIYACMAASALSAAAFAGTKRGREAFLCIGMLLGFCRYGIYEGSYLYPAKVTDGSVYEITASATDYSFQNDYGCAVDARFGLDGISYRIRLYLSEDRLVNPGDTVTGNFRLRYTAPGGKEDVTFHSGQGILLLGYQRGTVEIIRTDGPAWYVYGSILANRIKEILAQLYDPEWVPFIKALMLGDDHDLTYAVETSFRLSGIRHIIAVSGLHVMLLYQLIDRVTFKNRWITAILGIPLLTVFAAAAGFSPSVIRSVLMVSLMMLSRFLDREYDPPTALSFSALVMLFANPLAITSCAFQLTVSCVAGIQLFSERISEWMKKKLGEGKGKSLTARLKRGFISSVSITLSSMSLTTPISAWYFGAVSLVGVVTNLLTLWAVNLIFSTTAALCALYLALPGTAAVLAMPVQWLIRYVLTVARTLAGMPLSAVYTVSVYIVIWLVFVYCLLVLLLLQQKKQPFAAVLCGLFGLLVALLAGWAEPLMDDARMTVLDVGQGQSILLQSEGRTYLVDCGGGYDDDTADLIAETLLSQGITELDGVILTHMDRDHAGALENLLTRIRADLILVPGNADPAAVQALKTADPGTILPVGEDLQISYGKSHITIFAPLFVDESNENSLCVLFDTENCDILITGDRSQMGEQMLLKTHDIPQVDVLIAGHHGSKYSTSEQLLEAVRPKVVIISVGADNPYGHPAPEMLDRLSSFGCRVYRTDENGTIIYRR